jgi:hypothetical protein
MREGQVAGWAFARVAEEQLGVRVGRLLEVRFAPWTGAPERRAMVQTVVASLAGFGVSMVRALTTCPETITALRSLRFVARSAPCPAMVYAAGRRFGEEAVRISVLRADGGVLPLPSRSELELRQQTLHENVSSPAWSPSVVRFPGRMSSIAQRSDDGLGLQRLADTCGVDGRGHWHSGGTAPGQARD